MSEIKVKQLAETIKVPVERLLTQLREAGIDVSNEEQTITAEQKMQLLRHLKGGDGQADSADGAEGSAPKRITLKRKRVSELSASDSGRGSKKVKVEVRKKRTYVKRSDAEIQAEQEKLAAEEAAAAQALAEAEQAKAAELAAAEAAASAPQVGEAVSADLSTATETAVAAAEPNSADADSVKAKTPAPAPTTASSESSTKSKSESTPARSTPSGPTHKKKEPSKQERDTDKKIAERKNLSRKSKKLSRSKISISSAFDDDDGFGGARRRRRSKHRGGQSDADLLHHGFEKPTAPVSYEIEVPETIMVGELAKKLNLKSSDLIKRLMKMGEMVTINQPLEQEMAILVIEELGHVAKAQNLNAIEDVLELDSATYGEPKPRPPVVTVMGHVDHGKTSLLDYIRDSKVTSGEAGGITQHIGAYHVETDRGMITFLDTPGHEAFTSMRARGAQLTDIVILVVAADDGVMPQTIEAIQHARAAKVPLIVALNKMDKTEVDPDRVKTELSKHDVIAEDWGGDVMFQPISAKTGLGIDELLDGILIQAEVLELKAPAEGPARGLVIEARLDKGRGAVASVLVQQGTLNKGDMLLAGTAFGRVRALQNEKGQQVESAGPSMPVEVLGFSPLPDAGDEAFVVAEEKTARDIAEHRVSQRRHVRFSKQRTDQRETLLQNFGGDEASVLPILLKADVQGSVEALIESLNRLSTGEVQVKVIAHGIGGITASDVSLARASKAMIIGFNVRADAKAREAIENEHIQLHYYSVIYDVLRDIEDAMSSMLAPVKHENIVGLAEVRDVFRSPKFGAVAGCMVIDGAVKRGLPIRVLRDNVVIYEGELESLRRFKDDVNDVRHGMECGIAVKNYNDVKSGDQIEVYEVTEVGRTLRDSIAAANSAAAAAAVAAAAAAKEKAQQDG